MLTTGGYDEDSSPSIIIVIGATGSGKTSFINLASNSKLGVGSDLKSSTADVQASREFTVRGRQVLLIDTPGFQDTFKSDMDILDTIAQSLATLYERGGTICGIIYVHRISDVRFTGVAARTFNTLLAMCGDRALRNVAIVTNMWGKVTPEVGDARERELASNFFKPALEKGALLYRHGDTVDSAHSIIQGVLEKGKVTLQIQEEITDRWKRIEETAAGKVLLKELDEQVSKRLRHLRELQELLEQTNVDDAETREELRQEVLRLRGELATLKVEDRSADGFRKVVEMIFWGVISLGVFLFVKSTRDGD